MIKLLYNTSKIISAYLNEEPVSLRRGTINTKNGSILFTEKLKDSIIKYDPECENFDSLFRIFDSTLKKPFAIAYLTLLDGYLVSDLETDNNESVIKLFNSDFTHIETFQNEQLKFPYDISINETQDYLCVSDFNSNKIVCFRIDSNGRPVKKSSINSYMPLDIKIFNNRLFICNSCNFDVSYNKLIYCDSQGNSLSIINLVNEQLEKTINHDNLLSPQGIIVDQENEYIYTIGYFVDSDRFIKPQFYLFCFNFDGKFVSYQHLPISHEFKVTISDVIVYKSIIFIVTNENLYSFDFIKI